uniref:Band 7 domain-containing protein n=1 Tax=Mucochytrium quahogii TaxID=96639 RepID=A0A7S2S6C3_9STRA|mmetsp:Transcript_13203/g.21444  ORF Transcript_13203/g.21444 Transcript_13203/m.21444 type:complete len:453 (-) Transcript_13203:70-1428(-)
MGNFVTCAPNKAIIKSGYSGTTVAVGKTVFKFWICQQVELLSLELMTIEIESVQAETAKGVRVNVRAVAQVKVKAFHLDDNGKRSENSGKAECDTGSIILAAQHFLGDSEDAIRDSLRRTLEGHQRQILGTLTVEELYKNRSAFSTKVREHVLEDLSAMGYGLASYVVQKIDDDSEYMQSLGVTQTAIVKREAAEGEAKNTAEARKKVAVYKAEADTAEAIEFQRAHLAVNLQKEQEAASDRDLNLKKAMYDREVNQARAEATAAGPIEDARQQQHIVRERTKQEQVEQGIKLEIADQIVERTKKEMEGASMARLLQQQNEAKSITVIAAAEAEKIRAMGEADAEVIRMKGEAEAKVLQTKADAYKHYGQAAITQMVVEKLPEIAENISKPLSKTEKMVFISNDGNSASALTRDTVNILGQMPHMVKDLTGFDMTKMADNMSGNKENKDQEL